LSSFRKCKELAKGSTGSLFGAEVDGAEDLRGGLVRVAFESGADTVFDYAVPESLWPVEPGQRVEVPFGKGNKLTKGFCVAVVDDSAEAQKSRSFKLKAVKRVVDSEPLLDDELMSLAEWISGYYYCPLGQVLSAMVPAAVKKGIGVKTEKFIYLAVETADKVKVSSVKQKQIVGILQEKDAFDEDSALKRSDVMERACVATAGPFNSLAKKGVIKVVSREYFRSLPVVPAGLREAASNVVLNQEQKEALAEIDGKVNSGGFGVTLLHGVTDSGKTEVYIRAIETAVKRGKTAIVMLPEIALTAQTVERFAMRFKRIAVMHSRLTAAQRNVQWQRIKAGKADVVIGARSAVFAPLKNPGLIVIDEEHEASYKQDTLPRYHGRDVAIKRAQMAGAHCVLGTATPSLETLANCRSKEHYNLVKLSKRVMDLPMPTMELVDMSRELKRSKPVLIGSRMQECLKEVLAKGEQAILLLNRRGYSNFVFCPSCGHGLQCRNCDVTLTFHKRPGDFNAKDTVMGRHMSGGYAICHHCMAKTLVPQRCPLCSGRMTMMGVGTQKLEEELATKLEGVRVCRVDSDSMEGRDYYQVLREFAQGRIDVLAGTQMLAKGLHFPNVTLVGVVSADTALSLPDFRANERTFQLISQVAGRAGRSAKRGTVVVQTFLPGQPAIQFAMKHDYEGFVAAELEHRKKCNLPPYWRMAIVGMRDVKFDKLTVAAAAMRERLDEIVEREGLGAKIRGPMPAAISRVQRYHRMQIIVQGPDVGTIQRLLGVLRTMAAVRPAVTVTVDVDAINLL